MCYYYETILSLYVNGSFLCDNRQTLSDSIGQVVCVICDCVLIYLSGINYSALILSDIKHYENVCPLLLNL